MVAASCGMADRHWLRIAIVVAAGCQLLNQAVKFSWLTASDSFELQASARLLSTALSSPFLWSGALLLIGGIVLPMLTPSWKGAWVSLVLVLAAEILGRYVFFVSVVPKNIAASYLSAGKAPA